jgi:hypothetical protein
MPTISEWLALTEKQKREFLEDMERFNSYSDEAYELANSVVSNFREKYNLNQARITIGNKGGYLLIVAVIPRKEYEQLVAENIKYYLGFNICFVQESNS